MKDTFGARSTLAVGGNDYEIYKLGAVSDGHAEKLALLPENSARKPVAARGWP